MKKLLAGLFLLSSVAAFASPGVGTFSSYRVSGPAEGTYRIEILKHDAQKMKYTNRYTTAINGQLHIEDEDLSEDEVNSKEMNEYIVSVCETEVGGVLEKIKVPAGLFDTCKVVSDGQVIYLGSVPFGFVKVIGANGTLELTDYQYK